MANPNDETSPVQPVRGLQTRVAQEPLGYPTYREGDGLPNDVGFQPPTHYIVKVCDWDFLINKNEKYAEIVASYEFAQLNFRRLLLATDIIAFLGLAYIAANQLNV